MDSYVVGHTERVRPKVAVATEGLPHIDVMTTDGQVSYPEYSTFLQGAPMYFTTPQTPSGPQQNQWLSPSSSSLSLSPWSPVSSGSASLSGSPESSLLPLPSPLVNDPTGPPFALLGVNPPLSPEVGSMFQALPETFHFGYGPVEPASASGTRADAYIRPVLIPQEHHIRMLDEPERLLLGKEYQCIPCNAYFVSWANAMRHRTKNLRIFQCVKCLKCYSRNDYKKCHEKKCRRLA